MTAHPRRSRIVVLLASGALVATGLATLGSPAVADRAHGTSGVRVTKRAPAKHSLQGLRPHGLAGATPAGVPAKGRYGFLLTLSQRSTAAAYHGALAKGRAAATAAAKDQLATVKSAQDRVIADLPAKSAVLYRTHAVLAGVSVVTDVKNYGALTRLAGVSAVYPISPKSPSNSYAVPLQGAPAAWQAHSNLWANSTVAVIDTGIDYTHADFGGAGTVSAYDTAQAAAGASPDFPSAKVVGGYDLAGDAYDADMGAAPVPDAYPLDCEGHGTHVAGTIAGYGENADGSRYTGSYDTSTPFSTMRIGPGMAPQAKLLAYRVFGCSGSTDLVAAAIDRAADPNGDGITTDHADVVNMSLGSDFGSPEDGDSVATQAASSLMTMVVASGNAGDLYDVGGSPGNAPGALTVAASRDAASQDDTLTLSAPGSIAGPYAAERALDYAWGTDPDLAGDVARVSDSANLDGCDTLSAADAAAVAGKVAYVAWTEDDAARRCGSAAVAGNLEAAGATGFILGDDSETFSAGISGSTTIPGVLVAMSGAGKIVDELALGHTVTVGSTGGGDFLQDLPGINDTVAGFSSRGIGDAGNVKPDVTAVGTTVFSTGSGSGNQGVSESGTSMATPMVAGTAALVATAHPSWTAEQTKADIMNTAGQDVFTGDGHTGAAYGPQRVGSGRIQVDQALDNTVLAHVVPDADGGTGSVSASFGPLAVSAPTTLHKTIRVDNTGGSSQTYDVAYVARTTVPGATYSVSPSSVTVAAGASQDVTLTLTLDPSALTKTIDPTVAPLQGGYPRQFQADASGLVELTSSGHPSLRVPVYAAPRPVSAMTQPASLTLDPAAVQQATLPLSGQGFDQGTGASKTQSVVAGFELQATSGLAPTCVDTQTDGCVSNADERSADLKYVGATSDAPQLTANGQSPLSDGFAYFAISTQGAWRNPAAPQEFDVYIDVDGDRVADVIAWTTTLPGTDVTVAVVQDMNSGQIVDWEPVNASYGDTDTALMGSDVLVLPVWLGALPGIGVGDSRINYTVDAFSPWPRRVDSFGSTDPWTFRMSGALSLDVLHPGLALYGGYDGTASPLLYPDQPSSGLTLRRDRAAYLLDHGLGALVLHFHNAIGSKAQVVTLKDRIGVGLTVRSNPVGRGEQALAEVMVPANGLPGATGPVVLKEGATTVASGVMAYGIAQLTFALPTAGSHTLQVEYAGDSAYEPGVSNAVTLQVARTRPDVRLTLSRTVVRRGGRIRSTVQITTVGGIPATGRIQIRKNMGPLLASGTIVNGVAVLTWRNPYTRTHNVYARYLGDANYQERGYSNMVRVRVRR